MDALKSNDRMKQEVRIIDFIRFLCTVWLMRKFNMHLYDTVFSGDENLNYDTYEEALSAGVDKAIEF